MKCELKDFGKTDIKSTYMEEDILSHKDKPNQLFERFQNRIISRIGAMLSKTSPLVLKSGLNDTKAGKSGIRHSSGINGVWYVLI